MRAWTETLKISSYTNVDFRMLKNNDLSMTWIWILDITLSM